MKLPVKYTAAFLIVLAACSACGKRPNPAAATLGPPLVTIASVQEKPVNDVIELDGVVGPSASVNLVARVAGYLQETPFKEGDYVKKGQVLFRIESEPYREQVRLNQARLDQARADTERQVSLLKEKATSQASVENSRSQLQQAQANLRLAQINLGYCEVRATFDGVIGKRFVDAGNYVGASPGGTVLGTLQRLRPAYVNFAISERDLLKLRARLPAARAGDKSVIGAVKVRATLQGETRASSEGVLDFIDNSINLSTGSMQLRARFANEDLHLIPGLYAKASINTGPQRKAVLIPNAIVQADQQGSYVFIVTTKTKAVRRNIEVGEMFGSEREVRAGLKPGELVVINGISNIVDGQPVLIKESDAAAAAIAGAIAAEAAAAKKAGAQRPPPMPEPQLAGVKGRST